MNHQQPRHSPGQIRDAILNVMASAVEPLSVREIEARVQELVGSAPHSSVRSYLRLNTPDVFLREQRGIYRLRNTLSGIQTELTQLAKWEKEFSYGRSTLVHADCFEWIRQQPGNSFHAVVTDPPYGLHEYTPEQQQKMREGKGGVWRLPPSYDGHKRSPLPRFTTLTQQQLEQLYSFFLAWGKLMLPKIVPGGHIVLASNPLLSYIVSAALADSGFERRGEIARLTMTMRGGDRPKDAHEEFSDVSVMPRSMWEPWLVYRRPIEGRVQDNLRKWKTGGFRRISEDRPFGDVIVSSPTRKAERDIAPHPSLKPQEFMRQLVRAVLPLGEGIIVDPFAGGGSTLAAAEAVGYASIGIEKDPHYFELASKAIKKLAALKLKPRPDKSSYHEAF